ncbi:immune-associated nucleotide-binding protein 8-like isoform X2 [Pomacea canaliculata]|nr:immune-associated nucleotide-binding protein 8-like isoform X2 [Pomacea canaliculata]
MSLFAEENSASSSSKSPEIELDDFSTPTSLKNESECNALEDPAWRIVIVGKTGNGKSSLGNIILRCQDDTFVIGSGMNSTTTKHSVKRNLSENLEVVDTPDPVNCDMDESTAKLEVTQWKGCTNMGVVVVIRCDVRYTAEEYAIYKQIKEHWGSDFCKHLVVAFTFGDRLEQDLDDFGKQLENGCPEVVNVLRDANQQYVVFDCSAGKYDEPRHKHSVDKLMKLIKTEIPSTSGYISWLYCTTVGKTRKLIANTPILSKLVTAHPQDMNT